MIAGKRLIIIALASIGFFASKAQSVLPYGAISPLPLSAYSSFNDSSRSAQKWHLNTYSGLSAGYFFYNGGGASVLSVPVGLQLTRQLTNNVYAFAGANVTPALINFNSAFTNSGIGQSYPGMYSPYKFGMNAGVELGLMYINDAKTFSISGSIGVERGSFPVYQTSNPNRKRQ